MGHLFRALNLADGLHERGLPFIFLLNDHQPAVAMVAARGHAYRIVAPDATYDWEQETVRRMGIRLWIDDRLDTDVRHACAVKSLGLPLITFDDRGPGAALSDVNVAALIFDPPGALQGACVLQGPEFLILSPEISRFQRVRQAVHSVVVTLGGSDTYGVTVDVVRRLAALGQPATVIVGPGFEHWNALDAVLTPDFEVKRGVPSLIAEFSRHDLAITGGGVTPFEAVASGLPCVVIANEDFEIPVGMALESLGVARFAGHYATADWSVLDTPLAIEAMSRAGLGRVGLHGRDRVLDVIGTIWSELP